MCSKVQCFEDCAVYTRCAALSCTNVAIMLLDGNEGRLMRVVDLCQRFGLTSGDTVCEL